MLDGTALLPVRTTSSCFTTGALSLSGTPPETPASALKSKP
jgi:hypothetical protein